MRSLLGALTIILGLVVSTCTCGGQASPLPCDAWRYLAVQEGGRYKPLDTLACELVRSLGDRSRVTDPETGHELEPYEFYLVSLFQWQGWDASGRRHGAEGRQSRSAYSRFHQPDKWDRAALLRVGFPPLRDALELDRGQEYVSPLELSQAKIKEPGSFKQKPFLNWADGLMRRTREEATRFEEEALGLAQKLWSYQDHRMGRALRVLPANHEENDAWMSVASLANATRSVATDRADALREMGQRFHDARAAHLAGTPDEFRRASMAFLDCLRSLGPTLGTYPRQAAIDLEVGYNHWLPFRFAWVLMLLAFGLLLLSLVNPWKAFYVGGWLAYLSGLSVMTAGFVARMVISGRAPVTNMYESVIYLGLGVSLLGILFEILSGRRWILATAAAVATVALMLADNFPAALDPGLRPLPPVLRNNFWLVTHVMTITLSYAAFALAMGIGNISLGFHLFRCADPQAVVGLARSTWRAIQVGVLLLATGTVLGGVWADYSWGRFWGWDPKEVWALIALLGYLSVLHARKAGWVSSFGLAVLSVLCFWLLIMAWYGVNCVLRVGLHDYGFGRGGQAYVLSFLALQLALVFLAGLRQRRDRTLDQDRSGPPPRAELRRALVQTLD